MRAAVSCCAALRVRADACFSAALARATPCEKSDSYCRRWLGEMISPSGGGATGVAAGGGGGGGGAAGLRRTVGLGAGTGGAGSGATAVGFGADSSGSGSGSTAGGGAG